MGNVDRATALASLIGEFQKEGIIRLGQGDRGEKVVRLQKVLGVTADGIFGKDTQEGLQSLGIESGILYPTHELALHPPMVHHLEPATLLRNVPFYTQFDDRWKDVVLGEKDTFRKSGCAITCLAMLLSYFSDAELTPLDVDKELDRKDGYYGDSVKWDVFKELLPGGARTFEYSRDATFAPDDKHVMNLYGDKIRKGIPTLLGVDYGTDADDKYNHFVLGIGYLGDNWNVQPIFHDPATVNGSGYTGSMSTLPTSRMQYRVVRTDRYDLV